MLQSYTKYLIVLLVACMGVIACGKQSFDFDANPPDVGGSKDSAKQLIDTLLKFDDRKIVQASAFPGLVCSGELRLASVPVTLDFNYKTVGENLRIAAPPAPLFSTGYYAAPGELITIDIPQGLYQISLQIGAWTDNVGAYPNPPRDAYVVTKEQLSPGRNYVRNLYGGTIYLNSAVPITNPVTVTLGNVVKSPDFILGQSNNTEWRARIEASCVPWLELRSKFVSFVVPRSRCLNTSYPSMEAALRQWDSIITIDYQTWQGLSQAPADPIDQAPIIPYRIVFEDAMRPGVGGHAGNPVVVGNWDNWFDGVVNPTQVKTDGLWGLLHEIGHNNQQTSYWSWSTLLEVSNNLFSFKVADRFRKAGYPRSWPPNHPALGVQIINGKSVSITDSAIAFASAPGAKNFDGNDLRIDDPFARCMFFVQLFDYIKPNMPGVNKSSKDGWALMTELYSRARRAPRPNSSDLTMHDFVYRALCEMTQYDWSRHFFAWGISISDLVQAEMAAKYTSIGFRVWEYNPMKGTGGRTVYNPDPYARINWTVSASTFNSDGTGIDPNNGRPSTTIDGNLATYWHSQYSVAPPHTLTYDFGVLLAIRGIAITQRQDQARRRIRNIYIETSTNGTTWTKLNGPGTNGRYPLESITAVQNVLFPSTGSYRYVRITIPTKDDIYYTGVDPDWNNACLSEFDVIK